MRRTTALGAVCLALVVSACQDTADVTAPAAPAPGTAGRSGRYRVMRGAAGNERAIAARMGADARVAWAEPDYLRQPTAIGPKLWAF